MSEGDGCLACDLASGSRPLVGTIHRTRHWTVEHCIGPLVVGTLIVKPLRHVLRFADLTAEEVVEFGPLLHDVTRAVTDEMSADQTYITEWSHAGFEPGHIHFVVQPAWDSQREQFARPGPFLQVALFERNEALDEGEIEAVCERLRQRLATKVDAPV